MNLDIAEGIKLIEKANIKIQENRLFQQWNMEHIFMDDKNFITFEDYKKQAFANVNKKKLSKEEIHEMAMKNITEAEKMRKLIEKGGYTVETI
jgi:hypothetical protein